LTAFTSDQQFNAIYLLSEPPSTLMWLQVGSRHQYERERLAFLNYASNNLHPIFSLKLPLSVALTEKHSKALVRWKAFRLKDYKFFSREVSSHGKQTSQKIQLFLFPQLANG
jgi:hypothetical protein